MSATQMKLHLLDQQLREGYEYLAPFWEILPKYRRMRTLELEYDYAMACEERTEFVRRVRTNDKPGKRHMLPFVWRKEMGADGEYRDFQMPIRYETTLFNVKLRALDDKVATARAAWNRAKAMEGGA